MLSTKLISTMLEDIFQPHTSFRASCPHFSVGDKGGHEALKLVCGRNMSSNNGVFNFQFKFEIELITKFAH